MVIIVVILVILFVLTFGFLVYLCRKCVLPCKQCCPKKCNELLDHHVLQVNLVEYKTGKREYTRVGWDTAKLTLPYLAKTPRIYTEARMNNSRFSVYRGDFRKSIKACEFTHVGVFMRTRRVDSRFAAYRMVPIC